MNRTIKSGDAKYNLLQNRMEGRGGRDLIFKKEQTHVYHATRATSYKIDDHYRGTSPSIPPKPANIPLWKVSLSQNLPSS
eukprot:scaffold6549_cov286-Chaetoceros_neogracile.AAC.5